MNIVDGKPILVLDEEAMWYCLRKVIDAKKLVYDVETSGLNPRRNHVVGYVLTVGPAPEDTFYVPVRHNGGGNCLDWKGLLDATDAQIPLHPFEIELARVVRDRSDLVVVGHNLGFDLLFSAYKGIKFCGRTECTQVAMSLINENLFSYSLDNCARTMQVTPKLGDELYFHMAKLFGGEPDKKQMANYWKLAGNDPVAVDYACGDGISTWELIHKQYQEIITQELSTVWDVECRVTNTLARIQFNRMRINVDELTRLAESVPALQQEARTTLPPGLNVNSAKQIESWFKMQGVTDYPRTEKGNPSFNAEYLETVPLGREILDIRKYTTLLDRFITPLIETHMIGGYIAPNYNQLKADDFGTVTGRLSCNEPNIQQVYKRDKKLGKLFRKIFIPEDGYTWGSNDYSQCLAGDTEVMTPGGVKYIKDLIVGDWVHSYNDDKTPTLKRVTWSGKTGVRKLYRLHWITNGRTSGYLDATNDHRIRIYDGSYVSVAQLSKMKKRDKGKYPCNVSVMAMRRDIQIVKGESRNYIFTSGTKRYKESRLVYESVYGRTAEEVHHIDEDTLNDTPSNPGNHIITHIEELPGYHDVYDITVEDTHNFIANEICVHNCEPRIFSHYSGSPLLCDGYLANPPVDFYQTLSNITKIPRSPTAGIAGNCKQLALSIFYGAGIPRTALMLGISVERAKEIRQMVQDMCPEIKNFTDEAQRRARSRGYVKTVLGRRIRYADMNYTYKAGGNIVAGGNADLIKYALVEVDDYLKSMGCPPPIATVHDSIEIQFPEGRTDINNEVVRIMENCGQNDLFKFEIPQVVDNGVGKNWSEATYGED